METGEGQIVVDAGDMLSRCTNGVVPATTTAGEFLDQRLREIGLKA